MKTLILVSTLLMTSISYAVGIKSVEDWDPSIPTSESKVLDLIQAEADYFSFETDDSSCGGEVAESQLMDHHTFTTEDGNEVHALVLRFQVSKAENYCQSETQTFCEVPFQVLSENGIVMGDWACEN